MGRFGRRVSIVYSLHEDTSIARWSRAIVLVIDDLVFLRSPVSHWNNVPSIRNFRSHPYSILYSGSQARNLL